MNSAWILAPRTVKIASLAWLALTLLWAVESVLSFQAEQPAVELLPIASIFSLEGGIVAFDIVSRVIFYALLVMLNCKFVSRSRRSRDVLEGISWIALLAYSVGLFSFLYNAGFGSRIGSRLSEYLVMLVICLISILALRSSTTRNYVDQNANGLPLGQEPL